MNNNNSVLDISQRNLIKKFSAYNALQQDQLVINQGGLCYGFSLVFLLTLSKQLDQSSLGSWFVSCLINIALWDETKETLTQPVNIKNSNPTQLMEQQIKMMLHAVVCGFKVQSLFRPSCLAIDKGQFAIKTQSPQDQIMNQFNQQLDDINESKGSAITSANFANFSGYFDLPVLKKLLLLIFAKRLNRLLLNGNYHASAVFKEDDQYIFYDSNVKTGPVKFKDIDGLLAVIATTHSSFLAIQVLFDDRILAEKKAIEAINRAYQQRLLSPKSFQELGFHQIVTHNSPFFMNYCWPLINNNDDYRQAFMNSVFNVSPKNRSVFSDIFYYPLFKDVLKYIIDWLIVYDKEQQLCDNLCAMLDGFSVSKWYFLIAKHPQLVFKSLLQLKKEQYQAVINAFCKPNGIINSGCLQLLIKQQCYNVITLLLTFAKQSDTEDLMIKALTKGDEQHRNAWFCLLAKNKIEFKSIFESLVFKRLNTVSGPSKTLLIDLLTQKSVAVNSNIMISLWQNKERSMFRCYFNFLIKMGKSYDKLLEILSAIDGRTNSTGISQLINDNECHYIKKLLDSPYIVKSQRLAIIKSISQPLALATKLWQNLFNYNVSMCLDLMTIALENNIDQFCKIVTCLLTNLSNKKVILTLESWIKQAKIDQPKLLLRLLVRAENQPLSYLAVIKRDYPQLLQSLKTLPSFNFIANLYKNDIVISQQQIEIIENHGLIYKILQLFDSFIAKMENSKFYTLGLFPNTGTNSADKNIRITQFYTKKLLAGRDIANHNATVSLFKLWLNKLDDSTQKDLRSDINKLGLQPFIKDNNNTLNDQAKDDDSSPYVLN